MSLTSAVSGLTAGCNGIFQIREGFGVPADAGHDDGSKHAGGASQGGTANGGANGGGGDPSAGAGGMGGTNGVAGGGNGGASPGDGGAGGGRGGVTGNGGTSAIAGSPGSGGASGVRDGGPRWCAGQHGLFCEDFDGFDTVGALIASWTQGPKAGATFAFDTSASVPSPPNALWVKTTANANVAALLVHSIPPFAARPSKMRLEFALRIDAGDHVQLLAGAAFGSILMGSSIDDGVVGLEIAPGPALYAGYIERAQSANNQSPFTTNFPTEGQWIGRYAVEVVYSGATGSRSGCIQAYANGTRQLNPCLKLPSNLLDPPAVSVAIGIQSGGANSTNDVQVRFDDVLFTAE